MANSSTSPQVVGTQEGYNYGQQIGVMRAQKGFRIGSAIARGSQLHREVQWNTCDGGCDGFDCNFKIGQELPFREIDEPTYGGFGMVRKVRSVTTGASLVTKEMRWYSRLGQARRESILKEINIHRGLRHRHITRITGSYERQGGGRKETFFGIVIEPLAECDLGDFLEEITDNRKSESCVSDRKLNILWNSFGCLASGLTYLHKEKVKHKDIKPANILVYEEKVLLTDFGLSTDFSDIGRSTTSGPTGYTPKFAAPEVLNGEPRHRSADIFSLGCVFLEILTVLAGCSLSEFTKYLGSAAGDSYSQSIEGSINWISEISPKLKLQENFLQAVRSMLSKQGIERPTAQEIWTVATCTPRAGSQDGQRLCGACCLVTTDP